MASISLNNMVKTYPGNVIAVHDFTLDIEDKEFIVLVGPSGCGKSTTLRMIAGLEKITDGDLYIGDKKVNNIEPKDRNIAMVFQNYALYPNLTVYKNMAFGLKMRKVPKKLIEKKVMDVAISLELDDLLDRKPGALSGGQRQRVALGRAMVRDPEVFLLDEPLSNLDAKLRAQMRIEIIALHKKLETTFVYVTHDQVEAMTMADRMVVMKDGYIQQADIPKNIYEHPANLFVAGFVGSPQMNFIKCVLDIKDKQMYIKFCGNELYLTGDRYNYDKLKEYIGSEIVVGIRPEDISCATNSYDDTENRIEAVLKIKEMMGSETYLYFNLSGIKITAKMPGEALLIEDETAKLKFNMNKVHIFDINTKYSLFI